MDNNATATHFESNAGEIDQALRHMGLRLTKAKDLPSNMGVKPSLALAIALSTAVFPTNAKSEESTALLAAMADANEAARKLAVAWDEKKANDRLEQNFIQAMFNLQASAGQLIGPFVLLP